VSHRKILHALEIENARLCIILVMICILTVLHPRVAKLQSLTSSSIPVEFVRGVATVVTTHQLKKSWLKPGLMMSVEIDSEIRFIFTCGNNENIIFIC